MNKTFTKLKTWMVSAALLAGGITSVAVGQITYTFTNASATGSLGPTQGQINTAYAATNLNGSVVATGGKQSFTVPVSGIYNIEALGAKGGNSSADTYIGGNGAKMSGNFSLNAGDVVEIAVGQMGENGILGNWYMGGGGGGGSFVRVNGILVVAAGGGGGAGTGEQNINGFNGNSATTVALAASANGTNSNINGTAGNNGNGGTGGSWYSGAGGGGYLSNGTNPGTGQIGTPGISYLTSAIGGQGAVYGTGIGGQGGFGCGGGASIAGAGGGGYSGGAGGTHGGNWNATAGGGGGSFNSGTNQNNTAGFNTGDGRVVITRLYSAIIAQTASITCNGNSNAALSATVSGGQAPYTYTWLPSGGNASTATGLSAGVYTLAVLDNNSEFTSATFTVTEPAVIGGNVSSQVNATCFGDTNGSATVAATGGTSPYTYTWSPSGGNASTATGLSAGVYTCTIGDNNNCPTAAVSVTITSPAAITGTATSLSVCNGNTVALTGTGATSYTWSGGVNDGVAFTPTATTAYTVAGTNSLTSCTGSAVLTVTVNPIPTISVSGATICTGNSTTLTPSGASTYTYSGGSAVVSPTATTVYTITGTSAAGCQASAVTVTVMVNPCTGINEVSAENNLISVYPNPNTGLFTIDAKSVVIKTVKVMDVTGKLIYTSTANSSSQQIDITGFANGIYHIITETEKGTQTIKVVKE
jgi:hypothetical protein